MNAEAAIPLPAVAEAKQRPPLWFPEIGLAALAVVIGVMWAVQKGPPRDLIEAALVLLVLSVVIPVLGVTGGVASRIPIPELGGVMVSYWGLISSSAGVAGVAAAKGMNYGGTLLAISGAAVVAPIAVKATARRVRRRVEVPIGAIQPGHQSSRAGPCKPEIASANTPMRASKRGRSGAILWLLWMGNDYEWSLLIEAEPDAAGVTGRAEALGTVSPWYSLYMRGRRAAASARGTVQCEPGRGGCTPVALSAQDEQRDIDFVARVQVQGSDSGGQAVLYVTCAVEIGGTQGLAVTAGPTGVGATVQSPNNATDGLGRGQSYSFRCVPASAAPAAAAS